MIEKIKTIWSYRKSPIDLLFIILTFCAMLIPPVYYLYKWAWLVGNDTYGVSYLLGYLIITAFRYLPFTFLFFLYPFFIKGSLAERLFLGYGSLIVTIAILHIYTFTTMAKFFPHPYVSALTVGLAIVFGPIVHLSFPLIFFGGLLLGTPVFFFFRL